MNIEIYSCKHQKLSIKDLYCDQYICDRCGKHISTNLRTIMYYEGLIGILTLPLIIFSLKRIFNISELNISICLLPVAIVINCFDIKLFLKKKIT